MRKRIMAAAWLVILLLSVSLSAFANEEWDRPVVCCENRIGCQVLQMVMMGSFDTIDPDNRLSIRVLSAAYPKIAAVTQEDFDHFVQEFGVEEDVLRTEYYIALGCCLWADILMGEAEDPKEEEIRQVLLIFLDPTVDETEGIQINLIRSIADDTVYAQLAQRMGLPQGFIRYLIESENWYDRINIQ